jgi:hypothetical protein
LHHQPLTTAAGTMSLSLLKDQPDTWFLLGTNQVPCWPISGVLGSEVMRPQFSRKGETGRPATALDSSGGQVERATTSTVPYLLVCAGYIHTCPETMSDPPALALCGKVLWITLWIPTAADMRVSRSALSPAPHVSCHVLLRASQFHVKHPPNTRAQLPVPRHTVQRSS